MKYALYAICVNAHTHPNLQECELVQQLEAGQGEELSEGDSVVVFKYRNTYSYYLLYLQQCMVLFYIAVQDNFSDAYISLLLFPLSGCSDLFQHFLSECQLYLEAVPALFRLELLENIFSLLFLSDTDFNFQTDLSSTSTETQADTIHNTNTAEKKKSNSTKILNKEESVLKAENKDGQLEGVKNDSKPESDAQDGESDQVNPELRHLKSGCQGFLVELCVMEGILRLVREGLEGVCGLGQEDGRALAADVELAESLGCSVTTETFSTRLQRLSKYTAEAQWRLQIVTSNHGSGNGEQWVCVEGL